MEVVDIKSNQVITNKKLEEVKILNSKSSNKNGMLLRSNIFSGAISVALIITVEENVAWDYDKV
ncbi:TPA: hypothetical protein QCX23_003096 [Bacillus toyonensis]|nr:hypothetical protein [Bacillus toyonensis]